MAEAVRVENDLYGEAEIKTLLQKVNELEKENRALSSKDRWESRMESKTVEKARAFDTIIQAIQDPLEEHFDERYMWKRD